MDLENYSGKVDHDYSIIVLILLEKVIMTKDFATNQRCLLLDF